MCPFMSVLGIQGSIKGASDSPQLIAYSSALCENHGARDLGEACWLSKLENDNLNTIPTLPNVAQVST